MDKDGINHDMTEYFFRQHFIYTSSSDADCPCAIFTDIVGWSRMQVFSTGEVAKKLGVSRDSLLSALRSGAPEPAVMRIGGRRVFSEADIDRLADWYERRRQTREGFRHA